MTDVESPASTTLLVSVSGVHGLAPPQLPPFPPADNIDGVSVDPSSSSPPPLRSVSMSTNLADSVVSEVSHMIRPTTPIEDPSNPELSAKVTKSLLSRFPNLSLIENVPSKSTNTTTTPSTTDLSQIHRHKEITKPSFSLNPNLIGTHSQSRPEEFHLLKRTSSLGKRLNELLIGVVVSRWDNIVGPQCIYLWTEEMTSLFYPGSLPTQLGPIVKYVTDHTVDHTEIDENGSISHSSMRSALCIVHELGLAYLSLSIRIPSLENSCGDILCNGYTSTAAHSNSKPGMTIPHSVSVLANLQYLPHFLKMKPLLMNWLAEFTPKIGVLLCKSQLHASQINSWCAELCKTMTAVRTCWWQKTLTEKKEEQRLIIMNTKPQVHDDVNGNPTTTTSSGIGTDKKSSTPPKESWDYLPPSSFNKNELGLMLTSHLSTNCTSIIVGQNVQAINQVIRFLLCFSKEDEGYCSRYVLPTLPDTFMKGLFVQGLMLGEIGERSISVNHINSNKHPYTHVEMSSSSGLNSKPSNKIRQMNVQNHKHLRETTLIQELTSLWNSTSVMSSNTELFPNQVKEIAGFVSKFIEDLSKLKSERRYARLLLFKRSLHAKGISLITYIQSIRLKPSKEKLQLIRRIRDTLRLDEPEYLIVQQIAEKCRPGLLGILHPV